MAVLDGCVIGLQPIPKGIILSLGDYGLLHTVVDWFKSHTYLCYVKNNVVKGRISITIHQKSDTAGLLKNLGIKCQISRFWIFSWKSFIKRF